MVRLWCRHLLRSLGCREDFGLLILVDLGAPELSLDLVPKMICAAPGVSSVKLGLMVAIPLSQVPMVFHVTRDSGTWLPSHWRSWSRRQLPPQPSTAALVAASTSPCSLAAPVVAAEARPMGWKA